MAIHIVRLGTDRGSDEGLRIGTVRRPPRGVPKSEFASQNWYDVWLPTVASTAELMRLDQAVDSTKDWAVLSRNIARRWQLPKRAEFLIYWLPCRMRQLPQWAVTARMRSAVIDPSCANFWLRAKLTSNRNIGYHQAQQIVQLNEHQMAQPIALVGLFFGCLEAYPTASKISRSMNRHL